MAMSRHKAPGAGSRRAFVLRPANNIYFPNVRFDDAEVGH
jgi:hypothetical protein